MRPDDSLDAFQRRLGGADRVPALSPADGLQAMFRFFREERAEGCTDEDGDVLLFQWGTLDWGRGEQFELNITRQFRPGAREDDEIAQLSLTFQFRPDTELRSAGQGDRWCKSVGALAEFERFVLASIAYRSVESRSVFGTELKYEYV